LIFKGKFILIRKYAAILMTFYLKIDGRNERYLELKKWVDESVQ